MATIQREFHLAGDAAHVWDAVRDIGALHTRLVPGFVIDTVVENAARLVTFANGMVMRERIVDVDDEHRRIVWAVVGSAQLSHHNASLQLFDEAGATRARWITDVLPHEAAAAVGAMVDHGIAAMQHAMCGNGG